MDPIPPEPTGKATRRPKACQHEVVVLEELIDGVTAGPTSRKNRRARRILILGHASRTALGLAREQNKAPKACQDDVVVLAGQIDGDIAAPTSRKNRRARRILISGPREPHGAKARLNQTKTKPASTKQKPSPPQPNKNQARLNQTRTKPTSLRHPCHAIQRAVRYRIATNIKTVRAGRNVNADDFRGLTALRAVGQHTSGGIEDAKVQIRQ
jgi:hypothetical protein